MVSKRIRGSKLSLVIDGVDHWSDASSVVLSQDPERLRQFDGSYRFADPKWTFDVSGIQSLQPGSLWRALWDNEGKKVPFRFAPHGNSKASTEQPHFTGTLQIGPRPELGGEASIGGSHSFDASLFVISGPSLVTT